MDIVTTAADLLALLRGALAMAVVGSSVAVSATLDDAPLLTGQGWRYAAAALLLLGCARAVGVRVPWPRGREWAWLTGIAATGLVLFNVALVRGVQHAEPAVIAVAVACAPVAIGVLGPVLEGRRPHARVLTAAGVVVAGSVLVEGAGHADAVGVTWAAVALACEVGFTLLAVPVLRRLTPWGVSLHGVWIAASMLLVLGFVIEGPAAAVRLDSDDVLALGYLAFAVTAVAFVLWYGAVSALGSGRAALLCGVAPISAATVGVVTTSVAPAPVVWVGIGVVAVGLVAGLRPVRDDVGAAGSASAACSPARAAASATAPAGVPSPPCG